MIVSAEASGPEFAGPQLGNQGRRSMSPELTTKADTHPAAPLLAPSVSLPVISPNPADGSSAGGRVRGAKPLDLHALPRDSNTQNKHLGIDSHLENNLRVRALRKGGKNEVESGATRGATDNGRYQDHRLIMDNND